MSQYYVSNLYAKFNEPEEFKVIYYFIWISLYFVKIIYVYLCEIYNEESSINGIDVIKLIDAEIIECFSKCV